MPQLTTRPQQNGSIQQQVTVVGAPFAYQAVDDSSDTTHDSDATYLTVESGGGPLAVSKVSFPMFLQAEGFTPTQLTVRRTFKAVGGTPTFKHGFLKGVIIGFGAGNLTPTGSYVTTSQVYTTNPLTGLAWTEDDLRGLEVYFEGHASFIGAARFTMVNVLVDYVPMTNFMARRPHMKLVA